ncbi:MAG: hypothetical protein IPK33_00355 [Gemmatimonadetes bacterium]|nr:hypothetical protein [Gemmatimonadota bacterium]
MQELVRRRAAADREPHLSVSVDSGTMLLERDGALLREMRVQVGEERAVAQGGDTVRVLQPRGPLSVERVLGPRDPWEVPRGSSATAARRGPEDRKLPGRSVATPSCSAGGR